MTDLTEQSKNRHLEGFRWYYVKFKTGEIDICWLTEGNNDELGTGRQYFDDIILEVLAPVPSYKKLKEIVESEAKSHLQVDLYYNKMLELKDLLEKAEKVIFEVMDCREDREFYKDLADKYYEYKYSKHLNGEQNE